MATSLTKSDERSGSPSGSDSLVAFKSTLTPKLLRFREQGENLPKGSVWEVRIIEAGESLNGPVYTEKALREAVTVFEGSPVYLYKWGEADPLAGPMPHLNDGVQQSDDRGLVGNLVGSLEGVHYNEQAKALDGYLKVYDSTLREKMVSAYDIGDIGVGGSRDVFGLSIDAQGDKGADGRTVERITSANSVDVVTSPAAGGRIRRLVAALEPVEVKEAAAPTVKPYKHPEQGDGYAVWLAGKATDWFRDEQDAKNCAQIKDRLVLTEAQEEPTMKIPATTTKLKENYAKMGAMLKEYGDKLSAASDEEAPALLEEAAAMLAEYSGGMGDMEIEEATGKHAAAGQPYGQDAPQGSAIAKHASFKASSDAFNRMSAGLEEAIKTLPVDAPVALRESLVDALGHEPEVDEVDVKLKEREERIRNKVLKFEGARICESLGIHAQDDAMSLMDRAGIRFTEEDDVEGLKEALEAVLKARPYLGAAWTTAQQGGDLNEAATPKPAPVEALGQNVPLRESLDPTAGTITMTRTEAARKLAHLKKRMLKGDTKAAVAHRRLRTALQA